MLTGAYNEPDKLSEFESRWKANEHPAFARRIQILSHALAAHHAGLWGASVPTLLAQAEGIAVDLAEHTGWLKSEDYKKLLSLPPEDYPIVADIVRGFVEEHFLVNFHHGKRVPEFSRHAILHGADTGFATKHHSQRAILLIDYLCSLDPAAFKSTTAPHPE
ncbi:MAG: hypothetical protein GY930_07275 [bacterium]|nr:hypothetical protein [bacterium]